MLIAHGADGVQTREDMARGALVARAYIKACEALEKIVAKQYENRVTVTPESAFRHFGDLNQEVCKIYDIARDALSCSPEPSRTGSIAPTISRPAPKPEK